MKGYYLYSLRRIVVLIVLISFVSTAYAQSSSTWQQVPIRSKAQKLANYAPGEGFQFIREISYAPKNANIVYFVTDTSQVWKSTNGGASWQSKHKGFYANGGVSLGVSPFNELGNVVFVAGGQVGSWSQLAGHKDGIYRTTDGGENWQLVRPGLHFNNADNGSLFAFPFNNVVWAGTWDSGLLYSSDNGASWKEILPFPVVGKIFDIKLHPTDKRILYLAAEYGVKKLFYENESSNNFEHLGFGLDAAPRVLAINKNNPNIIHAITGNKSIYRSTNGAGNFSVQFNNPNGTKMAQKMEISPVDPNYIFVSFQGKSYGVNEEFYYTHDGGVSWKVPSSMDEKNTEGWVSGSLVGWPFDGGGAFIRGAIATHPTNRDIALTMGAPDHVAKTIDGGLNWKYSNSGYTGGGAVLGYSRIAWDKNSAARFAIGLTDMGGFLTEDSADTFRNFNAKHNGQAACHGVSLDPTPGSQVIVGACGHNYDGQIIQVSRDNGVSWTKITSPNTEGLYKFVSFSQTNANVIYADKFRSIDKGYNWTPLEKNVKALYAKNGDVVYSSEGGTIYKSSNRGTDWVTPYPAINVTNSYIDQIAVDPNDENRLYAAVPGWGLYIVTPTQATLRNKNNGIAQNIFGQYSTTHVAVDPRNGDNVYLTSWSGAWGHGQGIFRSTDKGLSWQNIAYNLAPINVGSVSVNPHNSYVYIGTMHGTWKLPPPGGVDTTAPQAPGGLKLVQ
ncbi:MAG: hypothetical protein IT291_06750 [Deltaproteobacteria bacterium]|nr:hypothetical protein [Deltaproteobacteria bacterium]